MVSPTGGALKKEFQVATEEVLHILKSLRSHLIRQQKEGVRVVPQSVSAPKKLNTVKKRSDSPVNIQEVRRKALQCMQCSLHKTRKRVVFGAGNLKAELMFVGEAPGYDEDVQGLPFVGRAGSLLTKIIEAMGYKREEVYIANILKCRPPDNRPPRPDEIEQCEPYLLAQIGAIQPKVIVALGNFAAQTLLKTDRKVSGMRGIFHEYQGVRLMPTYHPAYLLRNPNDKKLVWDDMKQVMAFLNKPVKKN